MSTQNAMLHNFGASINTVITLTSADTAYAVAALDMPPAFLMLQNVGVSPVYVRLTDDEIANPATTSNYTLVLAAGSVAADGQGGTLNLGGYTKRVSFISSTAGAKVNVAYSGRLGD